MRRGTGADAVLGGAGAVLGVLGIAATFAVLGPLGAIIVAWLVFSPDAVADTARGGGAGAIGAAAAAAKDYLTDEWRAGGPARQHRRTARRDRWWAAGALRQDGTRSRVGVWLRRALAVEHGLVLAGRGLRTAVVAAARAVAVLPAGAKAGAEAARQHRAGRTAPIEPGATEPGASEPTAPASAAPAAPTAPAGPVAAPATPGTGPATGPAPIDPGADSGAGQENRATTGDDVTTPTTTASSTALVGASELTTTQDLRAECEQVAHLLEAAAVLGGLLKDWQTRLPDAYAAGNAAGGPKTRALDEAVAAVSEAGDDGQALGEALGAIRLACDQADSLGEEAAAIGADGHTKGYLPA